MKLKQLFADDNAVSPVIGVILMVAITVILAAVIGTFVLGLGDQLQETSPTASFSGDYEDSNPDSLTISHDGGDAIERSQLSIIISDAGQAADDGTYSWDALSSGSGEVTAGSTAIANDGNINADGSFDLNGATVKVVWTGESGDTSSTLYKWSGPNA